MEANVQYVRQHVRSPTAAFNILSASQSHTFRKHRKKKTSVKNLVRLWLREKQAVESIHARAQELSKSLDRTIFFAIHVLHHLHFVDALGDAMRCPFGNHRRNFMLALLSKKCSCDCYSSYTLAMCEEFGYGDVARCHMKSHVNVAILRPKTKDPYVPVDCLSVSLDQLDASIDVCFEDDVGLAVTSLSEVYCTLDSGYEKNEKIVVHTRSKKRVARLAADIAKHVFAVSFSAFDARCLPGGFMRSTYWTELNTAMLVVSTRYTHYLAMEESARNAAKFGADVAMVSSLWGLDLTPFVAARARLVEAARVEQEWFDSDDSKGGEAVEEAVRKLRSEAVLRLEQVVPHIVAKALALDEYPSAEMLDILLNTPMMTLVT